MKQGKLNSEQISYLCSAFKLWFFFSYDMLRTISPLKTMAVILTAALFSRKLKILFLKQIHTKESDKVVFSGLTCYSAQNWEKKFHYLAKRDTPLCIDPSWYAEEQPGISQSAKKTKTPLLPVIPQYLFQKLLSIILYKVYAPTGLWVV